MLGWFDAVQRRHRPLSFVIGVFKKFSDDRAGHLAANVAYYCFFSVFPLLLLLVTVLAYVFHGHPDLQREIAGSALAHVPVVSRDLETGALEGRGAGVIVGLTGALWAGMGAMNAAQTAMNAVWDVPLHARPNFLRRRVRALVMLCVLGTGLIGATVVNVVGSAIEGLDVAAKVAVTLGNVALNVVVIALAFQTLTDRRLSADQILPGAIVAGVLYYGLQSVSTHLVARRIDAASDVYGTFATVIGLLTYFHVLAQVTILAVEVNVVRHRHLHPRSLFGGSPTEADRTAQELYLLEAKHREALEEVEDDADRRAV